MTFSNSVHEEPNALGLDVEGIEIYTPLSSKLTLLIACRSYEMLLRSYYKNIEWFEDTTQHAHLLVKLPKLDRTYVEMMMNGYETGDAVGCSSENVTLVNYLQVANSVRFVFSSTDNFDLVRHLTRLLQLKNRIEKERKRAKNGIECRQRAKHSQPSVEKLTENITKPRGKGLT